MQFFALSSICHSQVCSHLHCTHVHLPKSSVTIKVLLIQWCKLPRKSLRTNLIESKLSICRTTCYTHAWVKLVYARIDQPVVIVLCLLLQMCMTVHKVLIRHTVFNSLPFLYSHFPILSNIHIKAPAIIMLVKMSVVCEQDHKKIRMTSASPGTLPGFQYNICLCVWLGLPSYF